MQGAPSIIAVATAPDWWDGQVLLDQFYQHSGGIWATTSDQAKQALADPAGAQRVIIALALTKTDPLWEAIATSNRDVAVGYQDLPPAWLSDSHDPMLISEHDLAYRPVEVRELGELIAPNAPADIISAIHTRYSGCPELSRRQLTRLAGESEIWASPDTHIEVSLVPDLMQLASPGNSILSCFLQRTIGLRRVIPKLLTDSGSGQYDEENIRYLERLASWPLGSSVIDEESGEQGYDWSDATWAILSAQPGVTQRLNQALRTATANTHVTSELYYHLLLGNYQEAETLVDENLRLLFLVTFPYSTQALLERGGNGFEQLPNLALLTAELLQRRSRPSPQSQSLLSTALRHLRALPRTAPYPRFKALARAAFAEASLGNRVSARQLLARVMDLAGVIHESIESSAAPPRVVETFAAELYLPFWVATQLDDHRTALAIAELMSEHLSLSSRTGIAEKLTALTEEVAAGYPVRDLEAADGMAHSDPLLLVEAGEDEAAGRLTSGLATRLRSGPSRSSAEALVLLVSALTSPRAPSGAELTQVVDRSCAFWTDGMSSTFIAAAAAFGQLRRSDVPAAERTIALAHRQDSFTAIVQVLIELMRERPVEAMQHLALLDTQTLPRITAISGLLSAAVAIQMGRFESADVQFLDTFFSHEERLLRFGARLLPREDFNALCELPCAQGGAALDFLNLAKSDERKLGRLAATRLTAAERDLLHLIRNGLTTKGLAAARFVSVNTIRSQLKTLYRKMQVSSRSEAVALAEAWGTFDTSPPPQ